jgi:hypothetical protein
MSAATMTATADKNLALILEMGGDPTEGYDPIPPAQYLCFLNKDIRITPSAQMLLAWMRKWTLHARKGGRSAYASDGPRRPLRLKDAGEELNWQAPQVSRVWAELEDAGLVRKDEKDHLYLCGKVTPRRKLNAADVDGEEADDYGDMTEHEKFCCEMLPHYVWRQFKRLDHETRRRAAVDYWEADVYLKKVKAAAVKSTRDYEEEYIERILAPYGITLRRHDEKPKAAEVTDAPRVKVEVINERKLSVHNFSDGSVQAKNGEPYTTENGTVQGSYPYEAEIDREDRVSKSKTEPGSGLSSNHLPTLENEAPQTHPAEAAGGTPEAENLPVDGESKQTATDASAIEAYVVKLFGKTQSPAILRQFAALSAENNTSPANVTRFLHAKVEEKIKAGYTIRSAGALLQFAREDLAGWLKLNRRELSHSARQERPAPPPAPIPPAEELTTLERFVCENPRQPDNDYTRDRIATLRAQLGDDAPPPYQPPTKAEELAELEAQLQQFKNERGIDGATDPWVRLTQAKIRKLRQEIGTNANGAAG